MALVVEGKTLSEMNRRHVREGEVHIENQRAIIQRLADAGLPTEEAKHLLSLFEATQADHQRHFNQILEQQQNGERDKDGYLITPEGTPLS